MVGLKLYKTFCFIVFMTAIKEFGSLAREAFSSCTFFSKDDIISCYVLSQDLYSVFYRSACHSDHGMTYYILYLDPLACTVEFESIHVADDARCRDIGTELVRAKETLLRSLDFPESTVCAPKNSALGFWKKLGYKQIDGVYRKRL
jgi:ribosomal protein S18 acetylase RimI-like enzyme